MSTFHPVHDALAIASRSNGYFVIIHKLSGRTFHIAYAKQADAESARAQLIESWSPADLNSQFIKNADHCLRR
ncbi:MAG: hypothetical protein JWM36_1192 [Hyphomicrobiales bacterium]|nr:hypothetical protein [Hyphomicrobiales bacterium]